MASPKDFINLLFLGRKRISFDEYVDFVLHHPEYGYYGKSNKRRGLGEDFYTAPLLSFAFGKCISNFLISTLRFFPSNKKLTILDVGAGNGMLLKDIFSSLSAEREKNIQFFFCAVEQKDILRNEIEERFKTLSQHIGINEKLEDVESFDGVACFNEFFDALPFSRVRIEGVRREEIYVECHDGVFEEKKGKISSDIKSAECRRWFKDFLGRGEVDICPFYEDIFKKLSAKMNSGFVLIIDYGDSAYKLYDKDFPQSTLRCFSRNRVSKNPYILQGEQDITFSVNFSEIAFQAKRHGFKVIDFISLQTFLIRWGILDIVSSLASDSAIDIKRYNEIQKIKNLLLPGSLGEVFKVLMLAKNIKEDSFCKETDF
ncbi:MAG: hypothetical protein D6734_00795 [Candidatus Schekmanbacteria bacterium]|nr:MAG: hypothetical protein D6734_00795 [Candidatus Schekmanbacteria bacterium]